MKDWVFGDHALDEMKRRGLGRELVDSVLARPEQVVPVRDGRVVAQSRVLMDDPPRSYLIRTFVDVDRGPPVVVTV